VELTREEMAAQQEETLIQESTKDGRTETLTFEDLEIDLSRREVRIAGAPVRMKPKEFDLLLFLARNRGIALSRDLILERVWGWTFDGNSRTVDVHVRWLREKIEPDPANATRIVTVRGIGYRFDG
jgi:DNA-binding response OmpR family regulator